jgi:transporter family-2 protein
MQWLLVGLAALAGLSNPVQSAANAGLNKALGQPVVAAFAIYGVALLGLLVLAPFVGLSLRGVGGRFATVPWWAWAGGLCNALFVIAGAVVTKQIGSASFTVIVLVSAVLLSILLDQFGLMGLERHPVSLLRLLGGALAVVGVVLVSRF